jgi:glycosyltransferase involved in cell wall biosynthesis
MKLSIIVAVYNTEAYIEKCILSIYNENRLSLNDFEVIVVNDGSTDNSPDIVNHLQKTFSNLFLINKENGGQSSARNIGFSLAKGEYIYCLDSDDFIHGNMLKHLFEEIYNDLLDTLIISSYKIDDRQNIIYDYTLKNYSKMKKPITGIEFITQYVVSGSMYRYFYRTSIIKDNNLKLIEGIYHEDEEFIIQYLVHAKKIAYNNKPFYNHVYRSNSTVNNKDGRHRRKLIHDIIVVLDSLNSLIQSNINNKLLVKGVLKKRNQLALSVLLRMREERFDREIFLYFLDILRFKGYYPLKLDQLKYKQKAAGVLINQYFLLKLLFIKKK